MASAHSHEDATNGVQDSKQSQLRAAAADALKSPTTSVKQLLADTSAAPPVAAVVPDGLRHRNIEAATSNGPNSRGPAISTDDGNAGSRQSVEKPATATAASNTKPPTFQQTLADLRAFLLPFLKLLPFQSLQVHLKTLIGPLVRFCVRVTAKLLHRGGFGLASNIAFDTHILFWRWIINLFFREIRPRGGWRAPKQGA